MINVLTRIVFIFQSLGRVYSIYSKQHKHYYYVLSLTIILLYVHVLGNAFKRFEHTFFQLFILILMVFINNHNKKTYSILYFTFFFRRSKLHVFDSSLITKIAIILQIRDDVSLRLIIYTAVVRDVARLEITVYRFYSMAKDYVKPI